MSASDSQSGIEGQARRSEVEKVVSNVHTEDSNVTKVTHADGTVDYIDVKAIGGDYEKMHRGYFRSSQFIGTLTVGSSLTWSRSLTNGKPGPMSR